MDWEEVVIWTGGGCYMQTNLSVGRLRLQKLKTDLKCSQAEHFPNKVLFSNEKLCEKHMDWIVQPFDDLKNCKLE